MGLKEQVLKKDGPSEASFNRKEATENWRLAVSRLYDQIESWLEYLISKRAGSLKRIRVRKRENLLGEYSIQQLSISFGPHRFILNPRSRHVIGSSGRIDLVKVGDSERSAMLLRHLNPRTGKDAWEIRKSDDIGTAIPLTERSLDEILGEWVRG